MPSTSVSIHRRITLSPISSTTSRSRLKQRLFRFERGIGWKTSEGMPEYRIGADLIAQLTGGDPDAEYALLRGHVRLREIPVDLLVVT
ncbi:hypothetical protein CNY89_25010 [Amaricoccus sp. HAR-UPW-R2A-40]|nr:hypothetical protein CNY89_25010 [Amaricoccus sp. HAR-UPW-R2A-40]